MATQPYVVRDGDYLRKIAARLGFDADAVWNHSENDALRKVRPDPNILCAGDVLYVPADGRKWLAVNVGAVNEFRAAAPLVKVHVRFGSGGEAWAGEAYEVEGLDLPPGSLDGDGVFQADVPTTTESIIVRFPAREAHFTVKVGHLDPIDTPSGVSQRLAHLGHLPTRSLAKDRHADDMNVRAISDFQRAHSLPVTGLADDATRSALVNAHGA